MPAFVVSASEALRLSGEPRPRQSLPLEPGDVVVDDAGIPAARRLAGWF
jgi:hypothetical protein